MASLPHLVSSPSQFLGHRVASLPRPASASAAAASLSPRPTVIAAALQSPDVSARCPAAAAASLYEVLGVPVGASDREIKAAYRRLARVCHPDVGGASGSEEFMRVHAAYSTLSDPDKRTDYDHQMMLLDPRRRQWRPTHSAPSPSSFRWSRARTWETDQCW